MTIGMYKLYVCARQPWEVYTCVLLRTTGEVGNTLSLCAADTYHV